MALNFDYAAARNAGYSDEQILQGLKTHGELDFDVDSALKQYSASDILQGILPKPPAPTAKPADTTVMDRIKDMGISALKGAIGVPESAVGLADIVTGGYAGKGAEALGFRPAEAKSILNDYYSEAQKTANQKVADAKGFMPTVGEMVSNPSTLVQTGLESLPSMGAGGVVGRGVMAVAPKIAGLAGGAMGGAIGEGTVGAGQAAEQIRQANPDGTMSLGQSGAALASGIGDTVFAAVGGRIAHKLGIADIDTVLAGANAPVSTSKGVVRRMIEGGISEGVFEELPQNIQEQMWQNVAMDKPLMDGVPEQAAQGMLAGGLFGGFAGAALHGKPHAATEQPAAEPLLLGNTPDPFLSFPDGSVGRKSDAEAFINNLPEHERLAARSRLFGMQEQTVTPTDVLQAQSVDDAIAIANKAIEQGTPEFQEQRNSDIDAAWLQHLTDAATQRQVEFTAAEEQRRAAETQPLLNQVADQNVEQANAVTNAQGFDQPAPTAMQLAMQEAQARRTQATAATEQPASIESLQQGESNGNASADMGRSSGIATVQQNNAGTRQGDAGNDIAVSAVHGNGTAEVSPQENTAVAQGLPGAKPATQIASGVVDQAKSILTAAGVTGNERMAALRSIRTGENTIEDLVDAHPPKVQEAANADRNEIDAGGNGDVGGRGAGIPIGDGPVDGRGNVPVGGDGGGRQLVAGRDDSVPQQRDAAPDDNASPAANAQPALKRAAVVEELRSLPTKELRKRASRDKRIYVKNAIAEIIEERDAETRSKRSDASKRAIAKTKNIDPDKDSMAQAIAKLGGINRDSVLGRLKLAPEELRLRSGIRPVFTAMDGMPMESMGAALADLGYVQLDENGKYDQSDFEDKVSDIANGGEVYTPNGVMTRAQQEHEAAMQQVGAESEAEYQRIEYYADQAEDNIQRQIDAAFDAPITNEELTDEQIDAIFGIRAETQGGRVSEEDPAGAARESGSRNQTSAGDDFSLTSETPDDVRARITQQEESTRRTAAEQRAQDTEERSDRDRRDIAARQESSAENFQLGQSAEEGLSGQESLFSDTDQLRAARDARIESQRNKPKSASQLATDAKYARQEEEIARAKENAERRRAERDGQQNDKPLKSTREAVDESTGLPLNTDGTVTLYHHTSAEKAAQIRETGKLKSAAEPDVYLTTQRETDTGYGNTAVAVNVDPSQLVLDDEFPSGRQDFRIDTGRPGGSVSVKVSENAPRKSEAEQPGRMTAADVNKAITTLRAKWLGFTKVNTVQSVEDIPAAVQERAQADAGTEGIYDPQTKTVYLIADNIASPARAAWVASHEVIGHAGLRQLHDKSVNEALNIAGGNKYIKELAAAIQEDRGGDVSQSTSVEEAIAELSAATESGDFASLEDRYGVKVPAASRNGIIGAVARVYEAVKRFLASVMGKPVSEVSNADVRALIGEQQAAVEGRETNTAKTETKPPESETDSAMALQSRAPAAQPEEVVPKWAEGLPEAQKAALRKSGAIYTEETFKQKVAKLKDGALKKLQYGILDQFAPIKDQLGKIPYVMARMAKNADGTLEALMLYGRPHLDSEGGMLVDTTKKGFIETMQTLNGEHDRFFSWMAGRRAEQLKKDGRENLFTNEDISALSTLNQGTMKDGTSREAAYLRAQKDVAELNKSVLDIAEKSGLIDGESRKVWASDFYVPFYRVMEEGVTGPSIKSGLVNQKSIKKLKGGTNNLGDLTQNMLMNWSTLLTASAKNRAAKASLDAATQIGAATEADEATIRQMGKAASTKAVSYMENGVNRWHVVEDEHLLAAISALEFNGYNNQAMKVMSTFKNYLTVAVTSMPGFKVRNLIRDSISTIGVSQAGNNPFANVWNGGKSLLNNKDLRAQLVAGGGVFRFGTTMEGNRAENIKRLIDSGVADDTILNTAQKMTAFTKKLWHGYQEFGDLSENVNRAALYEKLRGEGMSHLEASFEARDLMDFGLSGAWAGVRALNQVLPFFNARLQGFYKLGRAYNDDPRRLGYVVGAVALASIALLAAYKDDDDFKKRSEADRNNYWWFKVGDVAYRIPRPFEIGAMGSALEHLTALAIDPENTNAKRFANQLGDIVNGQLAMNPIPQVFRPLVDVYANKDSFTGRPIENMAMQRLKPEDRYSNNTSELARMLSKSGMIVDPVSLVAGTGVKQLSPVQIDALIKGYFSGAGTLATAAVDGLLHHSVIDRGEALPATIKTFAGSFAESLPTNSSRYVDMLYSTAQDIEQSYASYRNAIKNGDIEKARQIMKDDGENIAKYHLVESLKKNETKINQQIQRVMNSKELTGLQKEETIRRLKVEQDKIARVFATRQ